METPEHRFRLSEAEKERRLAITREKLEAPRRQPYRRWTPETIIAATAIATAAAWLLIRSL